jgi:hypothetical protein
LLSAFATALEKKVGPLVMATLATPTTTPRSAKSVDAIARLYPRVSRNESGSPTLI